MSNRARAFAALLLLLSAHSTAVAQSCPAPSGSQFWSIVKSGMDCNATDTFPCRVGTPVTLEVVAETFGGSAPYTIQACDTVEWFFGDGGTQTVVGNPHVTHPYAQAGRYTAEAKITFGGGGIRFVSTNVVVANGFWSLVETTSSSVEGGTARASVRRTSSSGTLRLDYTTNNGTAKSGVDYVATSGTVIFADGELTKVVEIPLLNPDSTFQPARSFSVVFSHPDGTHLQSFAQTTHTVTINDDDPRPRIGFSLAEYSVSEATSDIFIQVRRTGDMTRSVTVQYRLGDSFENVFAPNTGLLTFEAGVAERTIAAKMTLNDQHFTGTRQYTLSLFNPTNFAEIPSPGNQARLFVVDDDPRPSFSISDATVVEGDSGAVELVFTVTRTGHLPNTSAWVDWTFAAGNTNTSDFASFFSTSGELSFFSSNVATLRFVVLGDRQVEGDEKFTITLSPDSFSSSYVIARAVGTGTIIDDDTGVGPSSLRMRKGETTPLIVRLSGLATARTFSAISDDPTVASVPASTTFALGSTGGQIPVTARNVGRTKIVVTAPPELGGDTFTIPVTVYEDLDLIFTPAEEITLTAGTNGQFQVRADPAQDEPLSLGISPSRAGVVEVNSQAVIPPGGSATIQVKALAEGFVTLAVTPPANFGGVPTHYIVRVNAAPTGPTITRIAPPVGATAGGTAVTLFGVNLRSDCSITFGSTPALDFHFVSATELTATAPAHETGTVDVNLACGTDRFTLARGFTYVAAPPEITRVTPNFGTREGGTIVRITGANLMSQCGIFFGALAARRIALQSPSEMWATTPRSDAETVDVTLRCGALATSLRDGYTFVDGHDFAASILSIEPLFAAPGQTVTLTGTRLRHDDRITFGDKAATIVSTSPDAHTVIVPELPLGKTSINIRDAHDRLTTTGPIFNVLDPVAPQVTRVTPAPARAGGELVVDGQGFRDGYSMSLGETPLVATMISFQRMALMIPAGIEPGTYKLLFRKAGGQIAAIGPNVTVVAGGPVVAAVSPACAPSDGGTLVTLGGRGFSDGARVEFGGVASPEVTVIDAETIRATAPANAIGSSQIVVTNADGTRATLTNAFTYHSPHDAEPPCSVSRGRAAHH